MFIYDKKCCKWLNAIAKPNKNVERYFNSTMAICIFWRQFSYKIEMLCYNS